jgi:hypothetical protein
LGLVYPLDLDATIIQATKDGGYHLMMPCESLETYEVYG